MTAPRLFHFTCAHAAADIDSQGVLLPNQHPWWPHPLVWLTDLPDPPPGALFGYPSGLLPCDRTATRYEVQDTTAAVRWTVYARRSGMNPRVREMFEAVPGGMPAHWWVTPTPVPVVAVGVRL